MLVTEKFEAENLIKKLPDKNTFEDIQYHLYVAEKLKNARQQKAIFIEVLSNFKYNNTKESIIVVARFKL